MYLDDALRKFKKSSYDLVLIDTKLDKEDMNGFQLL